MTTKKPIRLRCLVFYISLLLTGITDAFAEVSLYATGLVRLLAVQHNLKTAFGGTDDPLMHFIAYNTLKTDDFINRAISVPNTPDSSGGQAKEVTSTTESFSKLSLSQSTPSGQGQAQGQGGDEQDTGNDHHLRPLLDTLKQTMTQRPDWLLILLWDIDGTVTYPGTPETELHVELADTLRTLRQNKQVLLIYNTARNYLVSPLQNWLEPFPEPDIVIAGEGFSYFFNHFINNPVFDDKVPEFIREQRESDFNQDCCDLISPHDWILIRPSGCSTSISPRSLKSECPYSCVDSISQTAVILKKLVKKKPGYQYWQETGGINTIIFFLYHKFMNKGASFSRLMNVLSKEFPAFRDKIKIVISAGDSLQDTAMMHPDMHFPFEESYEETEDAPRLPLNTVFAGAVLSKAGELQEKRFEYLFEDIETVNSKVRSLLGIIEGTVTLLLKQTKLL